MYNRTQVDNFLHHTNIRAKVENPIIGNNFFVLILTRLYISLIRNDKLTFASYEVHRILYICIMRFIIRNICIYIININYSAG